MSDNYKKALFVLSFLTVVIVSLKYINYSMFNRIQFIFVDTMVFSNANNTPLENTHFSKHNNTPLENTSLSKEKPRNRIYTHVVTDETYSLILATNYNISNETVIKDDDPYYKLKSKQKSGLPISIHLVNPVYWLLPCLKDVPKCSNNACVFDQDNVTEDTDVVLVMGFHLKEWQRPRQRWPGQLYVLMDTEPPKNLPSALWNAKSAWRHDFNFTAHYRVDADIFLPYEYIKKVQNGKQINYLELTKQKNKTILWLVSHCRTQSKREDYVAEMKKYVDVDIFGRCSNTSLCRQPNSSADCLTQEFNKYKFYLSFENSICKDYITEKLFRVFLPNINVLPVVRGGADYARNIPEDTFIDASNFKTAKDLALYLKSLSADALRYSEVLRAKDQYRLVRTPNVYCTVCNKLRNASLKPKVYDINGWLVEQCRDPKTFN